MTGTLRYAPGWPGIPPRWTSSAKSGVGTAISRASRVWFTISHGIFNEIYYPRLDQACTRDMGLLVTDGQAFFSEEKRDADSEIANLAPGVPAYRVVNTCRRGRYRMEKLILADPQRDVVLQHTRFISLQGSRADYHLYVMLASHLANRGFGNTAWAGDYKGMPMLFAEREGTVLALACSAPWLRLSVGFVGVSDGWQDLIRHKQMTWCFERAENGNVALTGEVDLQGADGTFVLALGFGRNPAEAAQLALGSLGSGFDAAFGCYAGEWQAWHQLVWPRDLVETAGGLLAAGAREDARHVLEYLQLTQEADGHWPQNMWLDGTPFWSGVQMDETALPILLVDLARREQALDADHAVRLWPMVRRAAQYIVCNGPVTQQDRWEEDAGYSPFTLAAEVAALLAAADLADDYGEPPTAAYLRETADTWNACIERWIYVTGTDLTRKIGVNGYYVRIAPPEVAEAASPLQGYVPIKNRPLEQSAAPAQQIVSPDALGLVRFGLRAPDDPRIVDTVRVIDATLKIDTPAGPIWRRYTGDGYGEHEDGAPFDGIGIGRAWRRC